MTYQTILYLIGNAFNIYLFMYALHLLFTECRVPQYVLWIYGILYFAVNSAAYLIWNNPFINVTDSLLFLYGICFFYKAKWQQYCFYPISVYMISTLTEGVTALFPIINADIVGKYYIGISTIVKDFLFFFVVLYFRKTKKTDQPLPLQSWCMLFAVPLLSLTAVGTLAYRNTILPAQLIIVYVVLVAINILVFWLYNRLSAYYITQQQLQISQHQVELYSNQLSLQQQSEKQIHELHHELKHHLSFIYTYLQSNQNSVAMTYIEGITSDTDRALRFKVCHHPVINSIINLKINETKEKGIDFRYRIDIPEECPFSEPDLCVLLFNMLDNAIEAQQYVAADREKYIDLHIYISNDAWIFRVENSCREDLHFKEDEYPKSNKSDHPYHGYGIRNINQIAKRYNGQHDCSVSKSIFYETVMLLDPILK